MSDDTFNPETLNTLFKLSFKDQSTKANKDALVLSAEFLKLFTAEAVNRSADELDRLGGPAEFGNEDTAQNERINVEHLERILPQLLLDF
ncbi:centromere protein X-like protein [Syncephalastrum racemosum]|uniref:Centromere protein X-like protein n=1 Tax=Syncephalastrum racemosum TaxID=13706 RepID=A0A1X2H475_SYNRA|nr:centromere protein X-like protein [Syncephalastrum racemosum]